MGLVPYAASVLLVAGIYIVLSLGLNLEFGFTGLINFGHVAFMSIGAYGLVILHSQGVPFFIATLISIAIAGASGLILAVPTAKLREDYLAVLTIGFSIVVGAVIKNEEWLTEGPMGISLKLDLWGSSLFGDPLYLKLIIVSLSVVGIYFLLEYILNSPWGRVLKAIREDEDVARALGKNVFAYKAQALVIGSAIAGFSGVLWAIYYSYIHPDNFLPIVTFYAWIILVIGGSGNNRGTILGGLAFWFILSGTRFLGDWVPISELRFGAVRMAIIGSILIIIMRYRPQGILGKMEEMVLEKRKT